MKFCLVFGKPPLYASRRLFISSVSLPNLILFSKILLSFGFFARIISLIDGSMSDLMEHLNRLRLGKLNRVSSSSSFESTSSSSTFGITLTIETYGFSRWFTNSLRKVDSFKSSGKSKPSCFGKQQSSRYFR